MTARPSTPLPTTESFTHVHAALGYLPDGRRVPGFLPARRQFPVDYTVTAAYTDIQDAHVERMDCPYTIVGSVELPAPMTHREIHADLLEADSLVGPAWMDAGLAGARFEHTDQSWLEAWQAHRAAVEEVA